MSDLITISSSVLPYSARVLGFRGKEAISQPYHFEIFVLLTQEIGEEFDLADAIGAKAKLLFERVTVAPFLFAGIFANVEVLHAYDGHTLLRAHLVPRLWQLSLSQHSRVFTKMKVPDIITTILEENGVTDYELRLGGYEVEEHVCQYRESDLDFISRWMEREGIFYFFEHGDDGEKLILADHLTYDADELGAPIRYFPQLGEDRSAGQHFRAFTCRQSTLPTSVRLKDYDYVKPNLNVFGTAAVAENGAGEVSRYGERFFTPGAGDRLARTRAEELLARQAVYHAAGTRQNLRTGYTFELEEHPFPSFNTKYLTIEAHHSSNQAIHDKHFGKVMGIEHEDVYLVEIDAIAAKTQFRAESRTPWPRIFGHENGVVDGPAESEYAQIDDQGRYNAKFKFDESSLKNGKATTWVRMMQPHGGDIEGFHFPLRKGTEVIFTFLGGDPDRPVITGVVPNALKPSAVTLANYTKNVIQTGGRNRIEIEDQSGAQWMHLSTPASTTHLFMGTIGEGDHNFILETQGTGHIHTHGLLNVNVEGIMTETVVGDVTEQYDANVSQTIDAHKTTLVLSGQTETVLAGFTQTILAFSRRTILGPYTQLHLGPHTHTHLGSHTHTQLGSHTHTQLGSLTRTRVGTTTETLIGDVTRTVTGDVSETVSGDVKWEIGGKVDIKCDDWDVNTSSDRTFHIGGASVEFKYGADALFNLAASSELTVGLKSEIFAGASNEMTFGLSNEMKIAVYNETTLGPHIHDRTEIVSDALVEAATHITKMKDGSIEVKEHAFYNSLAGLHSLEG